MQSKKLKLRKSQSNRYNRIKSINKDAKELHNGVFSIQLGNILNVPYSQNEINIYVDGHFISSVGLCTDACMPRSLFAGSSQSMMFPKTL